MLLQLYSSQGRYRIDGGAWKTFNMSSDKSTVIVDSLQEEKSYRVEFQTIRDYNNVWSASVTTNITTLADQFKTQVKLSGVLKTARLYQKVGTTNKKVKKVGMKKNGIITLFKNL